MKNNFSFKSFKLLLLLPLVVILAGCSFSTSGTKTGVNDVGGVLVSSNSGDAWRSLSATPTAVGTPGSIDFIDTNELIVDPTDSSALYLASVDNGLYYTYNITNGWNAVGTLPKATINDVAVDAKAKCTVYAAVANKLYKTTDCSRTWSVVYSDNDPSAQVKAVAVDHYDNQQLYIGISRGDVMKSLDAGQTWRTIQRLNDGVVKILISPQDSRVVFVASVKSGLYRFNSNTAVNLDQLANYKNQFDGTNWVDLNSALKDYNLGFNFKSLVFSPSDNSLFLATDKVLLKSLDDGASWAKINLITPDNQTLIESIAVDPKNSKNIYYVTDTNFFKSINGGQTWSSQQLTTSRAGASLAIDFNNPNVIYLGVKKIKK